MMTFALARESKWSEGLEEALGRQNEQFYYVKGACNDGVAVSKAQSSGVVGGHTKSLVFIGV